MKNSKLAGFVTYYILIIGLFIMQLALPLAVNAEEQPEQLKVSTKFPSFTSVASAELYFDVDLQYTGGSAQRVFSLSVTGPAEYTLAIKLLGITNDLTSIALDPTYTSPESIRVIATPNPLKLPKAGKYAFILDVFSGNLKQSLNLETTVTGNNSLKIQTAEGLLSSQITAAKNNYFTFTVINTGTNTLDNITLYETITGYPRDWKVTFEPEIIGSLAANSQQDVKVNIRPPSKTISGDYQIELTAVVEALDIGDRILLRVTVLSETTWGWVGVGIIALIAAGLAVMFKFIGRR